MECSFVIRVAGLLTKPGEEYLIGSDTQKEFVPIMQNEYKYVLDLKSEAIEGIADENGTAVYAKISFKLFYHYGSSGF